MKRTLFRGAMPLCLVAVLMLFVACASPPDGLSVWKNEDPFEKLDLSEYITLGEYKNLTVDDPNMEVVELNDLVVFDFEGTAPGLSEEALRNMKAQRYDELVIGSGEFIPGFEEQMVGQAIGKPFDVKVTFPEDYAPQDDPAAELNGKEVVFKCLVHEIPYKIANLAVKKAYEAVTLIGIPEREKEMYLALFREGGESNGMSEEQLWEEMGGQEQMTAEIEERIAQEMFVYAIAQKEGQEATQAELQAYFDLVIENNPDLGLTRELIIERSGGINLILRDLTRQKVIAFVHDNLKAPA